MQYMSLQLWFPLTDHYGTVMLPCLLEVSGRLVGVCSVLDRCKGRGKVPCQLFLLTEQMQFSLMFSRPARIPVLAFASSPPVALADQGPRAQPLHPAQQEPSIGKIKVLKKPFSFTSCFCVIIES